MHSLAPLLVGSDAVAILRRRSNSSGGGSVAAAEARTPPGALSRRAVLSHSRPKPTPPIARPRQVAAAAVPAPRVATLLLCGDRHSHVSACCGDDAAHAPVALYGNFLLEGPAAAVKMPDGSLLVTLPAAGGGYVSVPRAALASSVAVARLDAEALAARQAGAGAAVALGGAGRGHHNGRCILHGELMQLSGSYRVLDAPPDSWPGDDRPQAPAERAVRRRCGGPRTHAAPLDVLSVAALPVGASLVLQAGARLSHPLCATPPASSDDDEEAEGERASATVAEAAAAAVSLLACR